MTATATVPGWLSDPALARVWAAVRTRLERNHLEPSGRVVLTGLSRDERHATGGLLGRPVVTERVTVDLGELDGVLARRSPYRGLADAVVAVSGEALHDRRAERSAVVAAREAPLTLARDLLAASLPDVTWGEAWLAGIRRSGLLTRSSDPLQAARQAVAVVGLLVPGDGAAAPRADGVTSRTELAVRVTGDAHGLDDGTVLAQLVFRALALDAGADVPAGAAARRDLWARYGVRVDGVSSTCLTLGLRALGDGSVAHRLALSAEAGDPVHLTPRDLRGLTMARHADVLVCENPRVLEAVADRFGGAVPAVCTAGQPVLVVLDVLRRLVAAGATLRYHGDFDWPGIAIANRLVGEVGVRPWLMNAADYEAAVGEAPAGAELVGEPVEASWDAALTSAMARHSVAVHEEAVLGEILANMGTP